jgi:tetratricopeptide (TPR) repeat protein
MNSRFTSTSLLGLVGVIFSFAACAHLQMTHVSPGESVEIALAKAPEVLNLPAAPKTAPNPVAGTPAVEPELPKDNTVERVGEAYSRGEFCMGAGKDNEAIQAFEETVKIDPTFSEAWQHLAMLYEKQGDKKKALSSFRQAKKLARR